MSSSPTDPRRNVQRRDSSPRSSKRRPRLLRASATEPSITTSNASRNALANSQSSRRALDMLSRVAIISGSAPESRIRSASPILATTRMAPMYEDRSEHGYSTSPVNHNKGLGDIRPHHYAGRYYSFPNFEMYEPGHHDEEKEEEKSP